MAAGAICAHTTRLPHRHPWSRTRQFSFA